MPKSVPTPRETANDDLEALTVTPCLQDVFDATYRVAHDYPGGVPALAQRMGMSANTLNLKVSLTVDTHHTNLREAVHIQHITQRYDILYAMAAALDHVCFHVPSQSNGELGSRLAKVGAEVGDVFRKAESYMKDGKITPRERRELSREVHEAIAALSAFQRVL